jgi:hypothetical protein
MADYEIRFISFKNKAQPMASSIHTPGGPMQDAHYELLKELLAEEEERREPKHSLLG